MAIGFCNFLIAYIFLLVAFACAFMILFPSEAAFEIFPAAIAKVSAAIDKMLNVGVLSC